ncbi:MULTISPECIES: tripartite tricarboxylate transporter substrate binding protein [unclassified Halomonas]|uniref:tripartite tricarboxylate transporter substrate binding protein n=1 Tax=unclassified Halomonas TaxID=2609666 RepID=UPI000487B491|nr:MULTISPECIES: tripartite tricarboxylate transporter substrate binding protein [unclassified Halomonas]
MRKLVQTIFILTMMSLPFAALADYPEKPITLIVPYQAGGSMETMARVFAEELGNELNINVLVRTQPGAGGKIGTTAASRAIADGYTLLFAPESTVLWPPIAENVNYSLSSFDPIIRVTDLPQAIVTSKSSGIETFEDLLALSAAQSMSYADQNSISRAFVDYIAMREQVVWVAVPTKGGGEMVPFLLGNKVNFAWSGGAHNRYLDQMNVVLSMTAAPQETMPEVPTMQERYGVSMPGGATIWAPAGLSEELRAKLTEAAITAAHSEAFNDLMMNTLGFPLADLTGSQLTAELMAINEDLAAIYEETAP